MITSSPDDDYDRARRETIIRRVWTRLDTFEVNTPENRYATVLHLRAGDPEASIDELAQKLGEQLGSKVTPEAFRKTLQRGRAKFLELLVQEVRATIHPAEPEDIEAEINALGLGGLYRRCRRPSS